MAEARVILAVVGSKQEHVVNFARRLNQQWLIVLAGRFFSLLTEPETPPVGQGVWRENNLSLPKDSPRGWRDELTGKNVESTDQGLRLAEVFEELPVALLTGAPF